MRFVKRSFAAMALMDWLVSVRYCAAFFFHAEGQAIIIETHASKFVDNAVEVVAAVMKQLFKLAACHAPVTLLKEPCDA